MTFKLRVLQRYFDAVCSEAKSEYPFQPSVEVSFAVLGRKIAVAQCAESLYSLAGNAIGYHAA